MSEQSQFSKWVVTGYDLKWFNHPTHRRVCRVVVWATTAEEAVKTVRIELLHEMPKWVDPNSLRAALAGPNNYPLQATMRRLGPEDCGQ
jgi:hypothetical protein